MTPASPSPRLHCPNCGRHWPRRCGFTCLACRTLHPDAHPRRIDHTDQGAQIVLSGAEQVDAPRKPRAPRAPDPRQKGLDL